MEDSRHREHAGTVAGIAVGVVALCAGFILLLASWLAPLAGASSAANEQASNRVSFVAVGDNLPSERISAQADQRAGTTGDCLYDYHFLYDHIKPYIEQADFACINEEATIAGDGIGPRGYPTFNAMDSLADAVVDTGFDWVMSASNHAYDWGMEGIEHSCALWAGKPVAFTGTAKDQRQADRIVTFEKNGITFALLNYTYALNGSPADVPPYAVSMMDQARIADQVTRAKQMADVVLVGMHWGTEKMTVPDDQQRAYAQLLADLGVDVVIGSHPHVIQPMSWVTGAQGNRTLVVYSLGNFVSDHDNSNALPQLEGMLSLTFVKDPQTDKVSLEDPTWIPLVNHRTNYEGDAQGDFGVYALKDYTEQLARSQRDFQKLEDPLAWLHDQTQRIMGSEFPLED